MRQFIREHNKVIEAQIEQCPVHLWKSILLNGRVVMECRFCGCYALSGGKNNVTYPRIAVT